MAWFAFLDKSYQKTGLLVTSCLLRRGLPIGCFQKDEKHKPLLPMISSESFLKREKIESTEDRKPSLEARKVVDSSIYFSDYEALI